MPGISKFGMNVIVGKEESENTKLMMATSHYLVNRYCFNKGAHYFKIAPLEADPATYNLDLFLARELIGIKTKDCDTAQKKVLEWLQDMASNDSVGLANCFLLCFDGLRSMLVETEFEEETGFGFVTKDVRKKNLQLLQEMLLRTPNGLRILACTPKHDLLTLLLDSEATKRINPKALG